MPDQPRTGAGEMDEIRAKLVARVAYYRDMEQDYFEGPLLLSDLEALLADAAALRTRLEEAEARERWIPVETLLPPKYERVLVCAWTELQVVGMWTGYDWEDLSEDPIIGVLAWRPLSDPYTPSKEQDHE